MRNDRKRILVCRTRRCGVFYDRMPEGRQGIDILQTTSLLPKIICLGNQMIVCENMLWGIHATVRGSRLPFSIILRQGCKGIAGEES